MSVMIVENKTIDRCVFAISQMFIEENKKYLSYKELTDLGRKLLFINLKSYSLRYREEQKNEHNYYDFTMPDIFSFFKPLHGQSNILNNQIECTYIIYGLLRAVACLQYQLEEDVACDSNEYQLLSKTIIYLCKKGDINYKKLQQSSINHSIYDDNIFNDEFYC